MTPLTEAQRRMVEDNLRLAYKVAGRLQAFAQVHRVDLGDVRQEAVMGLMRAVQLYDPDKGCAFSTYAVPTIHHHTTRTIKQRMALLRVRRGDPVAPVVWADKPLPESESEGTLWDVMPDETDYSAPEIADVVDRLPLDDRDRRILYLRAHGARQEDISQATGLCQAHVSRRLRRIKNALAEALEA